MGVRPPGENSCAQRPVVGHRAAEGKGLRGLLGAVAGKGAHLVSSGWSQLETEQKLGELAVTAHSRGWTGCCRHWAGAEIVWLVWYHLRPASQS